VPGHDSAGRGSRGGPDQGEGVSCGGGQHGSRWLERRDVLLLRAAHCSGAAQRAVGPLTRRALGRHEIGTRARSIRWVGGAFGTLRLRQHAAASAERAARARQPRAPALVGRGVGFCPGGGGGCRCRSVQISGAEGIDSEKKKIRERAWRPAPRQREQEGRRGLGNARGLDCHPAFLRLGPGEAATGLSRAATLHREEACRSMAQEALPQLATPCCCAALRPPIIEEE
jgi:hypothetical protein